jgi:hypothetical protein
LQPSPESAGKPQVEGEGDALSDADSDSQTRIVELAAALAKLTPEERAALMRQITDLRK